MELQAFWLIAIVACVAAFTFALKVRFVNDRASEESWRLRAGQEKDDWLVCAMVWLDVLCEKTEAGRTVAALGIVVLCWLSVRTFSRLRRLGKARGRLES